MVMEPRVTWMPSARFPDREFSPSVRNTLQYRQWLQRALNRALGLRLPVDGAIGPQARSALRSFQQRAGLNADGKVGPLTERALVAAGAPQPSASPPPPSSPSAPSTSAQPPAVAPNIDTLRGNIVRFASQEWNRWNKGAIKEDNPQIRPVLVDYWATGAKTRLSEPGWWSKYPWSAAFISWVMNKSGAGGAFPYAAGHAVYISRTKQNRLANSNNPFKAYRITEVQPRIGDLVCRSRAGSGATYDNIRPGMTTHCDIVTAVQPGSLTSIGGNVKNSVSMTKVPTNASGFVSKPGYFAVIRLG
jgi:hypothetical protein